MGKARRFFLSVLLLAVVALAPTSLAEWSLALAQDHQPQPVVSPAPAPDTLTIATFNIQVFGKKKAQKPEVMQVLAQTVARFDLVAIQEIRDKSGAAIIKLERMVDDLGNLYAVILSPRLGLKEPRESYAFIYRIDRVAPVGEPVLYQEPAGTDPFNREPFMVKFKCLKGKFDFVLINIHTDPDVATQEIRALKGVLAFAREKFPQEGDFIILGDLNADCDYYDRQQPNPIPGTTWLPEGHLDTTIANDEPCAYDRIIITDPCKEDFTGEARVFRFDEEYGLTHEQAVKVSDHYPVWARFYTGLDTD